MLAPGTRLGVYEVVAPLGAGGMGRLYRAVDTNLPRVEGPLDQAGVGAEIGGCHSSRTRRR
jgi:hypothetical protein